MGLLTRKACVSLLVLLLVACSGSRPRAPVFTAGETLGDVYDKYVVASGDTLFSIAWRYGLDFRELANANSIAAPYTIYPNQELVLREQIASSGPLSPPAAKVTPSLSKTKPTTPIKPKKTVAAPSAVKVDEVDQRDPDSWRWPAKGRVVQAYGASGAHKGIDIGGKLGEPVVSAAPGRVVYAGNGILGYGNLLIIKHGEQYLSAYGHNDSLLVKEGAKVEGGQKIAEIGDSGTNSVKLHFEIRKAGKPVDPIRFLPRR